MRVSVCIPVALILIISSGSKADEKKQFDIDKHAFQRAQKASRAKSLDAAITILELIDLDQVEDEEVIEHVDFSLRCAETADAIGIDRMANPESPKDVILSIDWGQLVATLTQKAIDEGPGKIAKLLADARKIQKQLPRYSELDRERNSRYGSDHEKECRS